MTSAPAIGFEYRASRRFRRWLALLGTLAVAAVALSALAPWQKLPLAVGVLLATALAARRIAASPVIAAGWRADNGWTLQLAPHQEVSATLASFRVLGSFVLLRLRTAERGVLVLLLAPDNSDADIRRRLRMRLAMLQCAAAATDA
ncbi:MAG: hypothetical protein KGJ97_05545 [Xanthomonadaceae bacterium]|nr:hypothetical protein [Xanthomonadaceae bacterium]MDE3071895.1 hypothetical protein [Pseudomonadota bacterium]